MDAIKDIPLSTSADQEKIRQKDLESYAILNTDRDPELDELVKVVAELCQAPIAYVSLIDSHKQYFKACVGIEIYETPRDIAFCDLTIRKPELLVIPDTLKHDVLRNNPLVVNAPHIRFYAGMPLITPSGNNIGTLCVVDYEPRYLSEAQQKLLKVQARQVMQYLELRKKTKELKSLEKELSVTRESIVKREEALKRAQRAASVAIFDIDLCENNVIYSPCFATLMGLENTRMLSIRSYQDFIIPEDRHKFTKLLRDAAKGVKILEAQYRCIRQDTGNIIHMSTKAEVLRDENGNPCNILGMNHDITEQKSFEQKLIDNEERWKLALEGAKEGVWDWNLKSSEYIL